MEYSPMSVKVPMVRTWLYDWGHVRAMIPAINKLLLLPATWIE